MEKVFYKALLYDCYGELLTKKQRQIFELNNHEDMSLGEISEITGVSPQGISDMLKRTEKLLNNYEEKLGFVKSRQSISEDIKNLKQRIEQFAASKPFGDTEFRDIIKYIDKLIEEL